MLTHPSFVASGNINVRRFVKISGDFTVAQAGAGERAIGVSQPGAKEAPIPSASTLAAASGDPLKVFQQGEVCELTVAVAVTAGQYLKSDANGKGVLAVAGNEYYAEVIRGQATVDDNALVRIIRGVYGT